MATADKMRAAEKLLSRLSERKKSIIEHVKQQTDLYSQHLASKLLIEGIQPPSWLRDPSASGSKELNEEDLISNLLRQYPQSSAPWSVARYPGHNNLVITGYDEKFSDGKFVENSVSNEDIDQKNDTATPGFSGEHHGECLINMAPEQNASSASHNGRILNIYTVPDQSLTRIQRSKSRQKALELRSSAKAPAKSGLRHESTSDVLSSQIGFSLSITDQPGQNNDLQSSSRHLLETTDISSKGERAHRDSFEPDVQETPSPGKKVIERHSRATVSESSGLRQESTNDFATSQSFRVGKPHNVQRDPDIIYPKTMEIDIDTVVEEHVDEGKDDEICSEVNLNMMEGSQSATLSQHGEVGSCHNKTNEQLVATISSLAMKESRNSQGCFIEGTRTSPASCDYLVARMSGDKQCSKKVIGHHSHATIPERSDLRHERTSDVVSSQIKFTLSIIDQPGQNNELPSSSRHLPEKSDSSSKGERAHWDSFEPVVQEGLDMSLNMIEEFQHSTLSQHELPSSSRHLRRKSDNSSKGERAHRDSFEPDVQESPETRVGNFGRVIGSATLHASNDSSKAELNCRSSEVQHETHNVLTKFIGTTDSQNPPVELLVNNGLESSPMHCMEQGDCNHEAIEKDQQVSSASKSKSSRLSYGQNSAKDPEAKSYCCSIEKTGMIQIANDEIKQYPNQQYQILSRPEDEVCSEHEVSSLRNNSLGGPSTIRSDGKNLSLERRLTHARIDSWPQVKRRKIEHQQAHVFATSQSFQERKPQTFQGDPDIIDPKTMEIDIDTGVEEHVDKVTNNGICSDVNLNIMDGIQSATLSQHGEVGSCYIKKNEQLVATISSVAMNESRNSQGCFIEGTKTSPASCEYLVARMSGDKQCSQNLCSKNEQLVATISRLTMKESRNSQGCFIEGTRTSPASCDYLVARMSGDKQCSQNLCNVESNDDNLTSESLYLRSTLLKEIRQSPKWEDGIHLQHSVVSLSNEDPHRTDVDQSMPVFEGFFANQQTDTNELDFAADGFDLCELDLPRSTLERASILAEICRSASLDRPSSHFSSTFKFQETSNLCKSSTDDGHFDHMEFGNNYPLNSDPGLHFQSHSSSSDDYKDALDGMPYSVSLAYSGERYGWDSRKQPPSPVGKLWNQLSSHTGSSGKCSISNPELTCFPIEEDPSSSEENKTLEGNAGHTLDEADSSLGNRCDKRQPLKDLTNMEPNPPMSASPEEETKRADSMEFFSSKFSVTGTQEKTFLGPKYHFRKKSKTSEKQMPCTLAADGRKHQISSIGSNAIKRAKESVKDSSSKPPVSKTSLKGQDHKRSLRESRTNNIVSNVRSFIPLIRQKQAATAACTGKRDVKVKALEAAEAAKRLMEKKVNERNQRKEALKFERAEKNLKHMELENKRKEEERKKKNADIAKKRLREDDEKKEKEKKRMRLESRQRQREQEEKKCVERYEKENQRTKNAQLNIKKELNNESKKQLNKEPTRGDGMALQTTDTNLTFNDDVRNHEECGTSGLSCDGEEMHAVDKSPRNEDLIAQKNQGKSYDISPYQCSDEEDEEDDELPIKKFVPSWSSRSSISLYIPLQLEVDPDMVFPPDSFCSMDEVLLHRKLLKKQVVA